MTASHLVAVRSGSGLQPGPEGLGRRAQAPESREGRPRAQTSD